MAGWDDYPVADAQAKPAVTFEANPDPKKSMGLPPGPGRENVVKFWVSKGAPQHVAEGIADRVNVESGFSPTISGDGGTSVGYYQHHADRMERLKQQKNWQDPNVQNEFAYSEVTGGDPTASKHWKEILGAPDRKTATELWTKYFERPAAWGGFPAIGAGKWNVSDDAIRHGMSIPDASVEWMPAKDYLAMLPPLEGDAANKAKRSSLQKSLDAGDQIQDLPSLDVKRDGSKLKVIDYDGRNRAETAIQEGVDLIPVVVRGAGKGDRPSEIEGISGKAISYDFKPVTAPAQKPSPQTGLDRFGTGVADPVVGAGQLAAHTGMVDPAAAPFLPPETLQEMNSGKGAETFDKAVKEREAAYERGREAAGSTGTDWARLGGNVVGGAVAAAPLMAMGAGGGFAAAAVINALAGGAVAALSPVTGDGNFLAEKAKQVGEGAALGGALGGVGNALARGVAPTILPAAQRLLDQGVRLLPGQMRGGALKSLEEVSTSVPFSGSAVAKAGRRAIEDWNRAMYDRVLRPIGEHYLGKEVGTKGLAAVEKKLSDAYDALKPNIHFKADGTYEAEVDNLKDLVSGLPADLSKAFDNIVSRVNKMMGPQKYMDGQTFKEVESELSGLARDWHNPQNSPLERKVGDAISSLLGSLRENLERVNPAEREALRRLNTAWAAFTRLREATVRRVTSSGVFTPGDLLMAERKMGGRNVFARGDGLLQKEATDAMDVMGNRYPDSGTAGRYATMGETAGAVGSLLTNPAAFAAMVGGHLLHAGAYTSPGTNFLRKLAGEGFPRVRNMLAQGARMGTNALSPGAGLMFNQTPMQPGQLSQIPQQR